MRCRAAKTVKAAMKPAKTMNQATMATGQGLVSAGRSGAFMVLFLLAVPFVFAVFVMVAGLAAGVVARPGEDSIDRLYSPAAGIDADFQRCVGPIQRGGRELNEQRGGEEPFPGDDQVPVPHHLEFAVDIFQLQLDGHGAGGLVDQLERVDVLDVAVVDLLEEGAGGAEEGGFDAGSGEDQEGEQDGEGAEDGGITGEARGEPEAVAPLYAVGGRVTNEAAGPAEPVHHGVAGVDAGGAMDAFHLGAVADVDAGGAHGDALAAADAVAEAFGAALFGRLAAAPGAAFLATFMVVGDHEGIFIEHDGLETAVGTDEGAGLFAEAGKDGVEDQGEQDH